MLKFRFTNKAGGWGGDYTDIRPTYKRCYRLFPNRNLTSQELSILLSPRVIQDYQQEEILRYNRNLPMKGEDRFLLFLPVVMVTMGLNLTFHSITFFLVHWIKRH